MGGTWRERPAAKAARLVHRSCGQLPAPSVEKSLDALRGGPVKRAGEIITTRGFACSTLYFRSTNALYTGAVHKRHAQAVDNLLRALRDGRVKRIGETLATHGSHVRRGRSATEVVQFRHRSRLSTPPVYKRRAQPVDETLRAFTGAGVKRNGETFTTPGSRFQSSFEGCAQSLWATGAANLWTSGCAPCKTGVSSGVVKTSPTLQERVNRRPASGSSPRCAPWAPAWLPAPATP